MLGAEMLRRLTAPLRAAAPDDQLAEVTTEIAELARDMARLEAERSSLIVAKLAGDPEAEARVTAIDAEAGAIRRRLADLRQAEGRLRSEIASGAQLELDEAATAGRRRLAELHQRQAEAARAFDAATAEHVRTIRVMQANAEEAAGLSDSPCNQALAVDPGLTNSQRDDAVLRHRREAAARREQQLPRARIELDRGAGALGPGAVLRRAARRRGGDLHDDRGGPRPAGSGARSIRRRSSCRWWTGCAL